MLDDKFASYTGEKFCSNEVEGVTQGKDDKSDEEGHVKSYQKAA